MRYSKEQNTKLFDASIHFSIAGVSCFTKYTNKSLSFIEFTTHMTSGKWITCNWCKKNIMQIEISMYIKSDPKEFHHIIINYEYLDELRLNVKFRWIKLFIFKLSIGFLTCYWCNINNYWWEYMPSQGYFIMLF